MVMSACCVAMGHVVQVWQSQSATWQQGIYSMALVGHVVPVQYCAGGLCKASRVLCWWVRVRGRRGVTGGQKGGHGSCSRVTPSARRSPLKLPCCIPAPKSPNKAGEVWGLQVRLGCRPGRGGLNITKVDGAGLTEGAGPRNHPSSQTTNSIITYMGFDLNACTFPFQL